MSESNYIKIYTGDFIIVQNIVNELEAFDIYPIIKDHTESARLAGFGGGIVPGFLELYVHTDELERAVPVVEHTISKMKL